MSGTCAAYNKLLTSATSKLQPDDAWNTMHLLLRCWRCVGHGLGSEGIL